jgi:PAS domain-containing protein
MSDLRTILQDGEAWLLDRVMKNAKAPSRYLSALAEVWHLSFQGLTTTLAEALASGVLSDTDPDPLQDPVAAFGRQEARNHRGRGVSLDMILQLLKLYRPAYRDLIQEKLPEDAAREALLKGVERFFDRVEIAFCLAWVKEAEAGNIQDLHLRNLELITERDRYVTIFESLPMPILLLDQDLSLRNLNHAASTLFLGSSRPGAWYYEDGARPGASSLTAVFPGFYENLETFLSSGAERQEFQWTATRDESVLTFRVIVSRMLDLPSTFAGILVILDDQTERIHAAQERERLIGELTQAFTEVKQLSGLLPICAWCKKIRDDQGYWSQLDSYLESHAGVMFTHGVCPDCYNKLRSEGSAPQQ